MANTYESVAQKAIDLNQRRSVAAKAHCPEPVDVAALSKKLGMTQMEFAAKILY